MNSRKAANNTYVVLAIPKKRRRYKTWRKVVLWFLLEHNYPFIFHSKWVKYWVGKKSISEVEFPPCSNSVYCEDQTLRSDPYLLVQACNIARHVWKKEYEYATARDVIFHYMSNILGMSYKDEANYLKNRVKQLTKLSKTQTARKDHGWEIDKLKEAGYLK